MENKDDKQTFTYTYSSKQQEEIKKIVQKYMPPEENKMEQLRKLDQSATQKGTVVSLIIGVLSTLIFGIGMCCSMVWKEYFIWGIFIGVIGLIGMGMGYPIYKHVTAKQREKLAPEILRLSEELLKK